MFFILILFPFSGYTNQIAECYDKMKYPLTERYPCPCTHYTPAPLDNWSDCMLETKVADDITATIKPKDYVIKVSSKEDYCGIGRRIQIIVCQGSNNNNASAAICGQKGESKLQGFPQFTSRNGRFLLLMISFRFLLSH